MIRLVSTLLFFITVQSCSPIIKEVRTFSDEHQYHAGFYLLDPATNKVIADYQADKYFTPASNTKILTLYAAKRVLNDPLPTFYIDQDSLATYLWPTGNPSFLNPELGDVSNYDLLANADSLVLSYANFNDLRLGSGWMWDDYNTSDAPEVSPFPIYGNLATFTLDSINHELTVAPSFLLDSITIIQGEKFKVERLENRNHFVVTVGDCNDCVRQRPLRLTPAMVASLYSDTLKIPVSIDSLPLSQTAKLLVGMTQDSVLKVMMQKSDNFLAEQILLQVAGVLTDTLEKSLAIDSIQYFLNQFLPDPAIWVDGSGVSRYNMITPRSIAGLWQELLKMYGRERLLDIVSVGGVSGTIKSWYIEEQPYIYGKTGTLRHNHNLSGIIITKSGKLLIFAYMNNHYSTSSSVIKQEMERVLHGIYEKY